MKKLMILGGSRYLLKVIETAHKMGIYVITCDYLPDNTAHKYSDKYCDISVIDKEAVLKCAIENKIDGIMSFGCDPGVVAAAYTAEMMGLPFQGSYESVSILQNKGKFRAFLRENGFNVPHAKSYSKADEPFEDLGLFNWPVIVKPVDSAGSKGVTKVDSKEGLKEAIDMAISCSHSGEYIIEDFLTFEGHHSSTDLFTVDGKLEFALYSDQLFDVEAENPYTPAYIIWPSTMEQKYQDMLTSELQRLMTLLDMKNGIYNIETCVANGGKPYIMEVSPRGGGCKIAELQKLAYGVDLIENEIRSALGMPLVDMKTSEIDAHWCEMVVHALPGQSGKFKEIQINHEIREKYVVDIDCQFKEGDEVKPFTGANMAVGDMFLKFNSREELDKIMASNREWLKIILE